MELIYRQMKYVLISLSHNYIMVELLFLVKSRKQDYGGEWIYSY